MIRTLTVALLIAPPALADVPACPTMASPAANAKVASIRGKKITRAEVDARVAERLCAARMEHARKINELRAEALEGLLSERLIAAAAKAAGQEPDAWVEAQVAQRITPPTEAVLRTFYEANKERMQGAQFEDIKGQIAAFLQEQARREAFAALYEGLKADAKVTMDLPPFRMPVEAKGPVKGKADAPITIVEFADFECGYCARALDSVRAVQAKYGDKVRVVFRDFPLGFHQNAVPAAIVARCAGAQGKYWEMHDALFAKSSSLGEETYTAAVTALGLDAQAFAACRADPAQRLAVSADEAAGRRVGVEGTPAFFINGISLSGARPLEDFVEIIDAELARRAPK